MLHVPPAPATARGGGALDGSVAPPRAPVTHAPAKKKKAAAAPRPPPIGGAAVPPPAAGAAGDASHAVALAPIGNVDAYAYKSTFPTGAPSGAAADEVNEAFVHYEWGTPELMRRRGERPTNVAPLLPAYLARELGGRTEDEMKLASNTLKHVEVAAYMRALASVSVYDALKAAKDGDARLRRSVAAKVRAQNKRAEAAAAAAATAAGGGGAAGGGAAMAVEPREEAAAAAAAAAAAEAAEEQERGAVVARSGGTKRTRSPTSSSSSRAATAAAAAAAAAVAADAEDGEDAPAAAVDATAKPPRSLWLPYACADNHYAFLLWPDIAACAPPPPVFAPLLPHGACDACDTLAASAALNGADTVVEKRFIAAPRAASPPSKRARRSNEPLPPPPPTAPHHEVRFTMPALRGEARPPQVRLGMDSDGEWVLDPQQLRVCTARPRVRAPLSHQALALALHTIPAPVALARRSEAADDALDAYDDALEAAEAAAPPPRGGGKKRGAAAVAAPPPPPLPVLALPPLPPFSPADADADPACPEVSVYAWAVGAGKTEGVTRAVAAAPPPPKPLIVFAVPKTLILPWMEVITRTVRFPSSLGVVDVHVIGHAELERRLYDRPDCLKGAYVVVDEAHYLRNLTGPGQAVVEGLSLAARVWYLSGTFMQNDGDEVWGLLALLRLRDARDAAAACAAKEPRPSPAQVACEIAAAWPRIAVLHVDPSTDAATSHSFPSVTRIVRAVPMTWTDALHYIMCERKTVTLGGVVIGSSRSNTYRMLSRLACNTPTKFEAIVANVLAVAARGLDGNGTLPYALPPRKEGYRVRQVVYSEFLEKGVDELAAMLRAQRHPTSGKPLVARVISGRTAAAQRAVFTAEFNDGKVDVLLISRCGSQGLNLYGATAIHLTEPSDNISTEDQTLGRIKRLGGMFPRHFGVSKAEAAVLLAPLLGKATAAHGGEDEAAEAALRVMAAAAEAAEDAARGGGGDGGGDGGGGGGGAGGSDSGASEPLPPTKIRRVMDVTPPSGGGGGGGAAAAAAAPWPAAAAKSTTTKTTTSAKPVPKTAGGSKTAAAAALPHATAGKKRQAARDDSDGGDDAEDADAQPQPPPPAAVSSGGGIPKKKTTKLSSTANGGVAVAPEPMPAVKSGGRQASLLGPPRPTSTAAALAPAPPSTAPFHSARPSSSGGGGRPAAEPKRKYKAAGGGSSGAAATATRRPAPLVTLTPDDDSGLAMVDF